MGYTHLTHTSSDGASCSSSATTSRRCRPSLASLHVAHARAAEYKHPENFPVGYFAPESSFDTLLNSFDSLNLYDTVKLDPRPGIDISWEDYHVMMSNRKAQMEKEKEEERAARMAHLDNMKKHVEVLRVQHKIMFMDSSGMDKETKECWEIARTEILASVKEQHARRIKRSRVSDSPEEFEASLRPCYYPKSFYISVI